MFEVGVCRGQLPSPDPSCSLLFSGVGTEQSQQLGPDRFSSRTGAGRRGTDGRFAKGSSGNPRGRPPGIPNPKRRNVPLTALRANPQAVLALFDRKPHLLRALTEQLLPPRARAIPPAERIGIDLAAIRTPEAAAEALSVTLAATSRGEIAPREALRIARQLRRRLRSTRPTEHRINGVRKTGGTTPWVRKSWFRPR